MNKNKAQELDKQKLAAIKSCISVDPKDPSRLHINIDKAGSYLMLTLGFKFSMNKFESLLNEEINKKLIGKEISPVLFDRLSVYIYQLAVYLTAEMVKVETGKIDMIKARKEQLREKAKNAPRRK